MGERFASYFYKPTGETSFCTSLHKSSLALGAYRKSCYSIGLSIPGSKPDRLALALLRILHLSSWVSLRSGYGSCYDNRIMPRDNRDETPPPADPSRPQCLILAGGLATRMRPLTEKIPKSLIEVGGRPFAHHQLEWLAAHGVGEVIFCVGYRGEMIRDYVGSGERWGLAVRYVDEGADLRGTAGALRLALDQGVLRDAFLVTYGDSFLPVDHGAIFRNFLARSEPALMTVFRNRDRWEVSNACVSGGKVTLYHKLDSRHPGEKSHLMQFVDFGLSAFWRSVIEREIEPGAKADLADLFHRLSIRGELAGLEVRERFYEIGSPAGLEDFRAFLELSAKV